MSRASWSLLPAIAVYAITWCWVAVSAPDRVPMHWGPAGVDRWGSRTEFLTFSLVTAGLIGALMIGLGIAASRLPASIINTPHRDYWLSPEHRPAFDGLMRTMMLDIAALILLLFAAINVIVGAGAAATNVLVIVFLLALGVVMVRPIARLYREPPRSSR
ncbi:DUF1648 domain-containing protein [Gordonia sp. (in: high G+C Gram-positive bacteria)]|uniref:DUF1648 domain-containing protein n=1 Tax=Gordonia sp. (in: high G+C Gram-positive bacteria) TaxID=84139 RepID=UPI0039E3ECFF